MISLKVIRRLLIILIICGLTVFLSLLLEPVRNALIHFIEELFTHRQFKHDRIHTYLVHHAVGGIIISIYALLMVFIPNFLERLYADGRNLWMASTKIKSMPQLIALFLLCVFMLLYIRYNINLMFLVVALSAWKLGIIKWLSRIFGKKELIFSLIIAGGGILFFIAIMLFFRVAIVMDVFYGDANRVFSDFTEISASHYRAKVHPFYVLIWQTLYHLFRPPVTSGSVPIRIMIAVFSGINVGIFSLFISRLTTNKILNVIACAIMMLSFPQIYFGAQMLECYIFTQTAVLLTILYFSFALEKRNYNLPALLFLALFLTGNNIAYVCIFGIFYLVLLFRLPEKMEEKFFKGLVFAALFIIFLSLLLLVQTVFYGFSTPSNILSMYAGILDEETSYIQLGGVTWIKYAADFFSIIMFEYLPFGIGNIVKFGWIWAVLLILPFVLVKKIKNKPLFFSIAASCMFLFMFHRIYGMSPEFPLYFPVILCVFLCLFSFLFTVLPRTINICVSSLLLMALFCINSFGTYNIYRINKFVFGHLDIGSYKNYKQNINALENIVAGYHGHNLFFYKALENTEKAWPKTPVHEEIYRAYKNNDLDIVMLPFSEANRVRPTFFFGLENRRKLIFEDNVLKDFRTGENLYVFPDSTVTVQPWDYSVEITNQDGLSGYTIKETETGVFIAHENIVTSSFPARRVLIEQNFIPGTQNKIGDIPDFSGYQYPLIMKTLYHEIMFSIIDGIPYARLFDYFHDENGAPNQVIWYRDVAYVALFLEFVNRTELIIDFIEKIDKMYDANRNVNEPDNLGEILYLQSLLESPNKNLIEKIIHEAIRIKDKSGNLTGTTDGARSSAYQNGWLIFGLERLGMDNIAALFNHNSSIDDNRYSRLLWFFCDNEMSDKPQCRENGGFHIDETATYTALTKQPYPYIDTGMAHFSRKKGDKYHNPVLTQVTYPLTWGDGTRPHIWHAVELFMYLKELKVDDR